MSFKKIRDILRVTIISAAFVATYGGVSALAGVDIGGENSYTGPNSENENEWEIEDEFEFEVENDAELENELEVDVETGDNYFGMNTQIDDISTGDIEGEIEFLSELNSEDWDFDVMDWNWDDIEIDLENDTTGPYSSNENEIEIEKEVKIEIENKAEVENELEIDANTGKNDVHCNTVVGDVETGDIDIEAEVKTSINQSGGSLNLSGMGGDLEADFSNSVTGPNSENENELDYEQEVKIELENKAEIENDIEFDANTGKNDVENNTVVGDISTGNISFEVRVYSQAN